MESYNRIASIDDVIEIFRSFPRSEYKAQIQNIRKAYKYAYEKHDGVTRKTGEPYIYHPTRVAKFLAEWGMDDEIICAGLLHDTIEDAHVTKEELTAKFGYKTANLVEAVTAIHEGMEEYALLSKKERDEQSDRLLLSRMTNEAAYVKFADRLDNLLTIEGMFEIKRLAKAEQTREIIIPAALREGAFHIVDQLENLCFSIEDAEGFEKITKFKAKYKEANSRYCEEYSIKAISQLFNKDNASVSRVLEPFQPYICDFVYNERSEISIYHQISKMSENIKKDFLSYLSKDHIGIYDLTLIVSDAVNEVNINPIDIFFQYYVTALSDVGFRIAGSYKTTHGDGSYIVIKDEMENIFRLFIRTEDAYRHYRLGNIIDKNDNLTFDVDDIDARDTFKNKVKIFLRNGESRYIEEGATVLDVAFLISDNMGLRFQYAHINGSAERSPVSRRVNDGETIEIAAYGKDEKECAEFKWIRYVNTNKARLALAKYFEGNFTPNKESEC